jgi:hypothetical protein
VEVIGHHDKFMQPEFSLGTVVVQNANKQSRRTVGLKKVSLAIDRRSYKESSGAGND